MNPTLDVLSALIHGSWNFLGENRILLYLNFSSIFCMQEEKIQGEHGVTEIIYPPNISAFVDENNRQIVTNFTSVLFNTQVKALKHDGHFCTFRADILTSLLQHNKSLKIVAREANMITVPLL